MVFSSTVFTVFFLPVLIAVYFCIPKRYLAARNAVLLVFSILFYRFGGVKYLWILLASTAINYLAGLCMNIRRPRLKKWIFILAIVCNLGLLGYYKYFGFGVSIIASLGGKITVPSIVLPIGISFFTFQGMSYVIDAYRGHCKIQKNPAYLLLYIAFFPQLVAGPIVRYVDVEEALHRREHTLKDFTDGMIRFMLGFGKKMLLAGAMGGIADTAFGTGADHLTAGLAWVGAIAYTFQIYFDFSAYSDMAIGLAQIFGFRFAENFRYPYIAVSVTDFWRRWHISLSTWFRDYVYFPLGGSRCAKGRAVFNLFVVWLLTGLWHGAEWSFILWGLYYVLFLILEKYLLGNMLSKIPTVFRWAGTMLIVITAWVFFRAADTGHALYYLHAMTGLSSVSAADAAVSNAQAFYLIRQHLPEWIVCIAAVLPVLPKLREWVQNTSRTWIKPVSRLVSMVFAFGVFLLSYIWLVTGSFNPFIYFQF